MYENIQDAVMRLEGTIVRLKGMPIRVTSLYVAAIDNTEKIILRYCRCFGNEASGECHLDDPTLDVSSPPLGYLNYTNGMPSCLYAVRQPARRQQQGITPSRLVLYTNGGGLAGVFARNSINYFAIGQGIIGKFNGSRDYDKRWELLQNYRVEVAFSRDIACSWSTIYYKAHKIGTIRHEDHIHIVTITSPSFKLYNFEGIFGENWRID